MGIWYEGDKFPSVEHAYQAAKTTKDLREQFKSVNVKEVKKLGNTVQIDKDNWEKIKYQVMVQLVTQKFATDDKLKSKLTETGKAYLEETNHWGDQTWGVCNGKGENKLGNILMTVRDFWL
jgi:ribA/ribD-fused uncharacterized protein